MSWLGNCTNSFAIALSSKRIAIASGLRYDLAVEDPEYVRELVTHHVGGYLKIAPEHTEQNVLTKMMKPGMGTYDNFKRMFDKFSKEAGKEQYLIPYFIAAHPGTENKDMMNLALWLKRNKFRVDQVQTFYPSPMALATAMYHSERNPLKRMSYKQPKMNIPRDINQRRTHKAFLRYHDAKNWPMLREELKAMGRQDLIGSGPNALIPAEDDVGNKRVQRPGFKKSISSKKPGNKSPVKPQGTGAAKSSGGKKAASKKPGKFASQIKASGAKGSAGSGAGKAKRVRKLK